MCSKIVQGGGSVMVWGAISFNGKLALVGIDGKWTLSTARRCYSLLSSLPLMVCLRMSGFTGRQCCCTLISRDERFFKGLRC